MTLSREILVLDFNDPADASKSTMDPFEVEGEWSRDARRRLHDTVTLYSCADSNCWHPSAD